MGNQRAGDCNGGKQGRSGNPAVGTRMWKNWNLGHGFASNNGYDGIYDYDEIDNYLRVVFDDPSKLMNSK